jgi:hypothetical protein
VTEFVIERFAFWRLWRLRWRAERGRLALLGMGSENHETLEVVLETERRRQRISEYVEGYRRQPEPEEMVAAVFDQTRAAWSMLEDW